MFVKIDVSLHTKQAYAHCFGLFKRIIQEFQAISFAFVVGGDADGAEGPRRKSRSVVKDDFCFRKHHMADDLAILFHHEIQFRNKVGVISISVEHIMLGASGTIDVPERLACEVFHLAIVLWLF